tara:strand:- start:957 stop:1604 length:648 start_codon:yes stop_codon:yes gene_type:complete
MTTALKVIIADDEPLAISNLKAKLAVYPNLDIVECFDNGDDTLQFLHTTPDIDLVFLDIQMPGVKGIEILQQTAKGSAMCPPLFILVTAYEQFAFSAFEHFAFDYLLKPVSRQRLAQSLLDEIDILLIEAAGNYMCIYTLNETLIIRETMKELLQRLPSQFVQVHRSTLLNLHHVHKLEPHNNDYQFTLSNGKQVNGSRRYKLNWADQLTALPQS